MMQSRYLPLPNKNVSVLFNNKNLKQVNFSQNLSCQLKIQVDPEWDFGKTLGR